eukprot:4860944-Pyramimonas_sp.AAC.1
MPRGKERPRRVAVAGAGWPCAPPFRMHSWGLLRCIFNLFVHDAFCAVGPRLVFPSPSPPGRSWASAGSGQQMNPSGCSFKEPGAPRGVLRVADYQDTRVKLASASHTVALRPRSPGGRLQRSALAPPPPL